MSTVDEVTRRLRLTAGVHREMVRESAAAIAAAVDAVCDCLVRRRKKLLAFGNGGSAAEAQHLAAELIGRYDRERRSLAALALTSDGAAVTAIGNDYAFAEVFARQLAGLASAGDVAVAISTSGKSENVLRGVEQAKRLGMVTIGLTGEKGVQLAQQVDIAIVIPSQVTALVQEGHLAVIHTICAMVDDEVLGPEVHAPPASPAAPVVSVSKVLAWEELDALRQGWREEDLRVVWTNGCFDLLHIGHLRSLEQASQLGDILVVGINSDASVRTLKGPGRPVVPAGQRAELVAGLRCVNYTVLFDDTTPTRALMRLRPDVHCKGNDYSPVHGGDLPEAHAVASYGGVVAFLDLVDGISTSAITDRLRRAGARPLDREPQQQ